MNIDFLRLESYFRDDKQRKAVKEIVRTRLADDRNQEECRYLMRFWWQLSMTYREVTLEELEKYVSLEKLNIILELLESLKEDTTSVDSWIKKYEQLPVIEDGGFDFYNR